MAALVIYQVFRGDRMGHEGYVSSHTEEADAVDMAMRLMPFDPDVRYTVMTCWVREPKVVEPG